MASREINIRIMANAGNTQAVFNNLGAGIQRATAQAKTLGPAVQGATTSVGKLQGAAVSGGKAINQFGAGSEQASGKLGKFGKIFSDNRGIVFGVAGLTSALAEAVGMMGMYGDTALRLKEAQEELNNLEEQGVTSGKAHADAVAEVVKQQRFFNMVSRNTILSQMDMVFFTTMVISGLVKMNTEGGAAAGMLGKLKGMFSGLTGALSTTTNNFGSFMNAFSPLPATMGKTQQAAAGVTTGLNQVGVTSALSATKVLAFTGALAGIGLAAYGIFELIAAAERLKASLSEVFSEAIMQVSLFSAGVLQAKVMLNLASEEEKRAFAELNAATEIQTKAMQNLGFTGIKAFMLTKEELKMLNDEIIRLSKEAGNSGTILNESIKEPLTSLESFNATLEEMRDIQAAINPHIADFKVMWNEVKPPVADAGKLIKGFVAGLELAPPLAEELEDDLNAWVESISKSEKEAAKVLTKFEQILNSVKLVNAVIATNEAKDIMGDPNTLFGNSFSQNLEESKERIRGFTSSAELLFQQFQNSVREDASLTAEEFIGAYKDLDPAIATIFMSMVQKAKDANAETIDMFSNFESEAQNAYNEAAAAASKWIDVTGLVTPVLQNINSVLGETVVRIDDQANMIEDNATAWDRMTESTIRQTEANFDTIITWAKTNDMLMSNREWQFKVKDAQVQGLVAAKEWTQQTLLEAASAEQFRGNLINLNSGFLKNVDTTGMLTSEIQTLITAFQGGSDAAIQLARDQNEAAISSLNFFDSLTGAKSKKDFKKAWKEMDWGSIPKRFKDDFKDMFKELGPIREKSNEVATAIRGINVALQFKQGSVGKTAISGTLKEITKDLGDIAKVDVGAAKIKEKIIDPINELNSKQAKSDALKEIPMTLNGIATALDDGSISLSEYNELMMQQAIETQNFNNLTPQQIQYLESIGIETGKAGDATGKFAEEMAKVEVTGIVVTTIAEMWANLGKMIIEANLVLQKSWSETMINTAKMGATTIVEIAKAWAALVKGLHKMNVAAANSWEKAMKNIVRNTTAATSQTNSHFSSLIKKLNSSFVKIANNWEKAMKNVVHNAKAAASQVNSALAKIKDKTVTITYVKKGTPESKGDVFSMANGGISAANGLYTSNGPTGFGPFTFGDNSGGRELLAFIPKDGHKAQKILDLINAQLGRTEGKSVIVAGGGGDRTITVPIVINIGGEQYSFVRKYRIKQGQEVASQVGG